MDPELRSTTERYLARCRNAQDRAQITELIATADFDALKECMIPRIAFGTSGLRGRMEAGYARMNDLTVYEASVGLCNYVLDTIPSASTMGVVIGHDHRHRSATFADIARDVLRRYMKVYTFDRLVHTPLVPFSVKELGAACGIMITASHNPKLDNGYKVYWCNGAAIIPPHDTGISRAILDLEDKSGTSEHAVEDVTGDMIGKYFDRLKTICRPIELRFCYTPMHGVGLPYARKAVELLGNDAEMHVVQAQAEPDPDFCTVKFPNPEEKGALDLAMKTAEEQDTTLVIATDPDADRLGVAEKVDGQWTILTGNQIGTLLAHELITQTSNIPNRAVLSSAVSSRMLGAMAKAENIHWEETLTGFKWLGNRAIELGEAGYTVIFSYEEALGFMPYNFVYDKDGIHSMLVMLQIASKAYSRGETLMSTLSGLYEKYGFFNSANSYISIKPSDVTPLMDRIRTLDPMYLGERRITRIRDLTIGRDSGELDGVPKLPVSRSSEMMTFWFDDAVLTIRGSGTEPKLKYYIEATSDSLVSAESIAKEIEGDLLRLWLH